MFVWARLDPAWASGPIAIDSTDVLSRALDEGVCFVPGAAFATRADLAAQARLSFATASESDLVEAVARLNVALSRAGT